MGSAKGLRLLISTPTKFTRHRYTALRVLGSVGSMKRDTHRGGIADDSNALLAGLELIHFVNVRTVHSDAFGIALLVQHSSAARIANEASRPSGKLGNVPLSRVIDKLVK